MDKYKYLGTVFSKSGTFLHARKHVTEQAMKAMYLLNMRIKNFDLPIDLQLKLFDNTILPILTYGCEVFGFEDCKMLEVIQNQFLRSLTHLRKSTPLYIVLGEVGRFPLEIIIAWLVTEYDVARNSHVLHWNSSIPRATSYSVNSQATILLKVEWSLFGAKY